MTKQRMLYIKKLIKDLTFRMKHALFWQATKYMLVSIAFVAGESLEFLVPKSSEEE